MHTGERGLSVGPLPDVIQLGQETTSIRIQKKGRHGLYDTQERRQMLSTISLVCVSVRAPYVKHTDCPSGRRELQSPTSSQPGHRPAFSLPPGHSCSSLSRKSIERRPHQAELQGNTEPAHMPGRHNRQGGLG